MAARLLVIQHVEIETPGIILDIIESSGSQYSIVKIFDSQPLPGNIGQFSGLIVMGGPMGVYDFDKYPRLVDELSLIKSFLDRNKPIIGICLGSQLLAAALGARVHKGEKEIGWHKIRLTENALDDPLWRGIDNHFTAFHWHGDIFDLPPDTVPLASSKMTSCQGFRYKENSYGLLFHMEVTEKMIEEMTYSFPADLVDSGTDKRRVLSDIKKYLPTLHDAGRKFFGNWLSTINK